MRTVEATIRRLQARPVAAVIPPDMIAGHCDYSSTGFALHEMAANGSPGRCTCRPCIAPEGAEPAGA